VIKTELISQASNLSKKENKVKPIAKQSDKKAAFTIIELMTVMSVIIILIGLLVPGLNALKQYARKVTQKNQFYAIDVALETFNAEWDGYPESRPGISPCGATQLATAMVGEDLLGYDPTGTYIDPNSSARRLYLPIEKANAYKLVDLYGPGGVGAFTGNEYVLCDVYTNVEHLSTGKLVGMPVLYFKANTSNQLHDFRMPGESIYNYLDNKELVRLGMPWNPPPSGPKHRMEEDPMRFYLNTWNDKIDQTTRPNRADSFILISAGPDGEYGSADDICNFEWRYREEPPP